MSGQAAGEIALRDRTKNGSKSVRIKFITNADPIKSVTTAGEAGTIKDITAFTGELYTRITATAFAVITIINGPWAAKSLSGI